MSRLVNLPLGVETDADVQPVSLLIGHQPPLYPVLRIAQHWREWIDILDSAPQRDVWMIEIEIGVCEIHYLCYPTAVNPNPTDGEWILVRWGD